MSDPIIDEIRRNRLAHTRRFDGDLHRICEDLRVYQKVCGHEIVRFERSGDEPENAGHAHKA